MNCEQVKTVLDDYLDGTLSPADRSAVEAHCRGCRECREELAFLKKYRKAASRFPTLQPPDDFLKKVHSGIDEQRWSGVVRALFFPLRVKVPLEAAALLALAVTGVLVFKPYRTGMIEYGAERPPAVTEEKAADDTAREHDIALNRKRPAPEKKDAAASEKRREARPAPEQEDVAVTVGSQAGTHKKEQQAGPLEISEITLSLRQNAAPEEAFAGDRADSNDKAKVESGQPSLRSSAVPTAPRMKKSAAGAPGRDGISAIDSLARALGGKITRKINDETTGAVRLVVVEIPAENFSQFVGGLGARWSVLGPVPAGPPAGTGTVRITMHIQN